MVKKIEKNKRLTLKGLAVITGLAFMGFPSFAGDEGNKKPKTPQEILDEKKDKKGDESEKRDYFNNNIITFNLNSDNFNAGLDFNIGDDTGITPGISKDMKSKDYNGYIDITQKFGSATAGVRFSGENSGIGIANHLGDKTIEGVNIEDINLFASASEKGTLVGAQARYEDFCAKAYVDKNKGGFGIGGMVGYNPKSEFKSNRSFLEALGDVAGFGLGSYGPEVGTNVCREYVGPLDNLSKGGSKKEVKKVNTPPPTIVVDSGGKRL